MKYTIGVDIGGTNIVVGIIDESYNVVTKESFKTNAPRSAEEICDDIISSYMHLSQEAGISLDEIEEIGIACPGIIKDGVVVSATNLKFTDTPLKSITEEKTGLRCEVCNDANAVALAEYIVSDDEDIHSLVAVTIGTGIGGGIVIDGKIIDGFNGAGAELGHITVEKDGRSCACGSKGCLETYCSASALVKETKKAMIDHPDSKLWEICSDINDVDGKTVFRAAELGDKVSQEVLDTFLNYLSIGVINMITLLQPEVLCIGGGMSKEKDALIEPLKKLVIENSLTKNLAEKTTIKTAVLFNDAGLVGAAAYIRSK
ncbi:MAG: ROK family protein [Clostridia bacterium]|nr:ROK family protein [Clostridia bacterium]